MLPALLLALALLVRPMRINRRCGDLRGAGTQRSASAAITAVEVVNANNCATGAPPLALATPSANRFF